MANWLIEKFFLGTYEKWGRSATIFWQIDEEGGIRSGKIMAYDYDTGSRIKDKDRPLITWFHSEQKRLNKLEDYNLQQCLFGEHQLAMEPKDKPIGIVESEKTAIIMTALWPDLIWMACGGLTQIKKEIFLPLLGRKIILFPDLNAFDKWEEKREVLVESGFDISISPFLEESACEEDRKEGYDLAGFFLERDIFFWLGFDGRKISGFLGSVIYGFSVWNELENGFLGLFFFFFWKMGEKKKRKK